MIKFYYNTSPNPMKIALCLEEMNLPYEAIPIDTRKGDQHSVSFKAINPNAKAPAIEDGGHVVFGLLYDLKVGECGGCGVEHFCVVG